MPTFIGYQALTRRDCCGIGGLLGCGYCCQSSGCSCIRSMRRRVSATSRSIQSAQHAHVHSRRPAMTSMMSWTRAASSSLPEARAALKAHLKAAGLPEIRLHDARRTAATLLHVTYGVPPNAAASYLGHDPATYNGVYVRGDQGHDLVAAVLGRMQAGVGA